jgi:hypothetical protein
MAVVGYLVVSTWNGVVHLRHLQAQTQADRAVVAAQQAAQAARDDADRALVQTLAAMKVGDHCTDGEGRALTVVLTSKLPLETDENGHLDHAEYYAKPGHQYIVWAASPGSDAVTVATVTRGAGWNTVKDSVPGGQSSRVLLEPIPSDGNGALLLITALRSQGGDCSKPLTLTVFDVARSGG